LRLVSGEAYPDRQQVPSSYPPRSAEEAREVYWPALTLPQSPAPEVLLADPDATGVGGRAARRSGLVAGLLIGIVLALAAGAGGFFAGTATGARPRPGPAPSPSPSLHVYEADQAGLNKTRLSGEFAPLAQPLLPWMGGCTADTDAGGIKLPTDESRHVFCRYGGTTVHFSLYRSSSALGTERAYRASLLSSTDGLAPGAAQPGRKKGGVSGRPGDYVEFAWKADDGRAWCGVWWDRDDVPLVGLRLEALCQEGLGGSWEPLRDLWQRYS
jgi:hypothetical protein